MLAIPSRNQKLKPTKTNKTTKQKPPNNFNNKENQIKSNQCCILCGNRDTLV